MPRFLATRSSRRLISFSGSSALTKITGPVSQVVPSQSCKSYETETASCSAAVVLPPPPSPDRIVTSAAGVPFGASQRPGGLREPRPFGGGVKGSRRGRLALGGGFAAAA